MGWRSWLGRKDGGQPGPAPLPFDALIDLNPGDLPAGLGHEAAVATVVGAVGALPGAGWISVEVHPRTAPVAARVFPAGTSTPQAGEAWASLLDQVRRTAEQALADAQLVPAPDRVAPGEPPDTFEEAFAQRRRLDDAPGFGDGQDDAWGSLTPGAEIGDPAQNGDAADRHPDERQDEDRLVVGNRFERQAPEGQLLKVKVRKHRG